MNLEFGILIVLGIPMAVWPYEFARLSERLDAIGSKRSWSEVEPANWRVTLTRIAGVGTIVIGAGGVVAA